MTGDQGAFNKIGNAVGDVFKGDLSDAETELSGAENDVKVWLAGAPAWVQATVATIKSLVTTVGDQALTDASQAVVANGLTTAAFTSAAKTLAAQLPADAKATLQDVYTVLNAKVSSIVGANATAQAAAAPSTDA